MRRSRIFGLVSLFMVWGGFSPSIALAQESGAGEPAAESGSGDAPRTGGSGPSSAASSTDTQAGPAKGAGERGGRLDGGRADDDADTDSSDLGDHWSEDGSDSAARSRERRRPASKGAVVANPVALLFGLLNADVGFAVDERLSANVGFNYWSFSILGVENTAWGASVGCQIFFTGDRYDGAFVYPALEYAHSEVSVGRASISGSLFGPSAIVGYQWDWRPFTLRVGGGIRYYLGEVEGEGLSSDLSGVSLKLDGSIGVTF